MARPADVVIVSDDDATESSESTPESVAATSVSTEVKPSRKRKSQTKVSTRVTWSDDSSDADGGPKKRRKRDSKKLSASTRGRGKKGRGRLPKGVKLRSTEPRYNDDSESYSDSDLLEDALPQYIRDRRLQFDRNRETLREKGLRLPPDYSGVYFSDDERLADLEEKPQFDEKSGIKPCRAYKDIVLEHSAGIIPASIAQYLRDYQVDGVRFLHDLFVHQKGGILGDDMGLGKTVQVVAFLTAVFGKTGDRRDAKRMRKFRRANDDWYPRALIICPGSLIQNWRNELDRWGWWEADLYHGAGKDDVLDTARAGRLEVMITTYATYKKGHDQVNRVPWDVVVADECHSIKAITAEVTKAMNQVNALCRIGLTGTAIQNKYEELWALLNWTNPGKFGTIAEWKNTICKPLTIGQSHDATIHQLSEARKTAKKLRFNLLPRFFLRRMKSLIAHQLPKKTDKVVFCPLSDLQREAYENVLGSDIVNFVRSAFDSCSCGSGKTRGRCCFQVTPDGESWKSMVFPIVNSLQKLSNHLNLIIPQTSDVLDKHKRELRFLQVAMPHNWATHYNSRDSLMSLANPEYCGKWKVLKKLLKFWHTNGDKVLVFSHSVRLLRILQHLFSNTSYSVSYLDGSLSYEERQQVVDDFNSDPGQFVFLISTKAGGVGLNITSANKVVIMDPHWNPSYDLQAQDRAYRIGQVRDVDVYRFVSTGTIEEITYARQIYKQQQANIGYNASNERRYFKGVQQDADRKGEIFGIRNLLTYHGDQVILRDIVNKTNIAEAKAGVKLIDIDMDKAAKDAEEEQQFVKKEGKADDDETGGLKQLAALITKDDDKDVVLSRPTAAEQKPKHFDPIQAILASEGVEYTHENSEVVGTSKVEDELSRQAQMATSQDADPSALALFFDSQGSGAAAGRVAFEYEYNPPAEVRQRQFCTMAATFGFPSATEFALAVESMTQEERRNYLDLFYRRRAEVLKSGSGDGGCQSEPAEDPERTDDSTEGETPAPDDVGTGEGEEEDDDDDEEEEEEGVKVEEEEVTEDEEVQTGDTKPDPRAIQRKVEGVSPNDATASQRGAGVPTKPQKASLSIWVSDDEETDEL
ncbi:P-loop containing nucleoside triphosphate hydrolase protein [Durotheca rogersii]|uniref:P-loop containing nucleoside triphosphate hydrolase protein n=1 Tax=Durotheca rogersii TaxID=419775 RepID=UPI00221F6D80|nr:P-loop containing nucleoside triphosphate hydrolase protein [Durotheca rogersii]KAI5860288.1 P-loop containing nucleoside triphosphate hydrolase protein [Durotheca rogersii]